MEVDTAHEVGDQQHKVPAETAQADNSPAFDVFVGGRQDLPEGLDDLLIHKRPLHVDDGQHRFGQLAGQKRLDGITFFAYRLRVISAVREVGHENTFALINAPV